MSNLKSYLGSVVLAGLLLQGCGSSSSDTTPSGVDAAAQNAKAQRVASYNASTNAFAGATQADQAQATSDLTMKFLSLYATDTDIKALMDKIIAENSSITTVAEAAQNMAAAMMISSNTSTSTTANAPQRSILTDNPLVNAVKSTVVSALDTSVGNKITGAAFDVVLNSDGVTVVMLDAARKSQTISQVMVDALEANWGLTAKMCPMLRDNAEFGEKFTALAYERPIIAKFFFERIDARMYGCLTDAMLLSNKDKATSYTIGSVEHSTNAYMGLLMKEYAKDYFITPDKNITNRNRRLNDNFVSLLLNTGKNATYKKDANGTITFENHGDGNELTNEKFFYSLFKTPVTTNDFVAAMDQVNPTTRTMLMDNIFLGGKVGAANPDTLQGQLNIIAIGSAMYDGIFGKKDASGVSQNAYGFASYAGAFIGFASLIPTDRFMTYGRAFVDAGYTYADFHGIDVWSGVSTAAQTAWDNYTATDANATTASNAPSRSAGKGVLGSSWYIDTLDILAKSWSNVSLSDISAAALDSNKSILSTLQDNANIAYDTFLDGRNDANASVYPTIISNGLVNNDKVYGMHGLIELAMQEDIYKVTCGNASTDYIDGLDVTCENNASYTMADAKAAFTLPPFADLTMSFAYNTATEGAMAYYNDNVNADWLAKLSTNDLIRQYFYPSADNVYIPNWLLAVDWLSVPADYANSNIATTDFNFNAGYFDIYVASTNNHLLTDDNATNQTADINLAAIAGLVKDIQVSKVDMGSDSIIAVDANGTTLDGLYIYKVRAITPEDTQVVMNALTGYGNDALTAIGLDSSNAANVNTDTNTTAAN